MGLSRSLSPETGTLEGEEEDASEGDTELDAAEAWLGVWPLGDRVLWRRSPTPPWPPPPPPPPPPLPCSSLRGGSSSCSSLLLLAASGGEATEEQEAEEEEDGRSWSWSPASSPPDSGGSGSEPHSMLLSLACGLRA